MKNIFQVFICCTLVIANNVHSENWTRIFQSNDAKSIVYLDFDSVSRTDNFVSAWTKADYVGYTSYTFTEVNCIESAVKYHSLNVFKNGITKSSISKFWYYFPKTDNTIALEIYKRFC